MKPVFLKSSQLDFQKWDQRVDQFGDDTFQCYSWYLNAVCNNWNALVMGDYEYILPLPTKTKGFFKILYQPFFTRQLKLIGPAEPDQGLLNDFLAAIPSNYVQRALALPLVQEFQIDNYQNHHYLYQRLWMHKPVQEIRNGYSENYRRILKKFNIENIEFRNVKPELITNLFASETATKIEAIKSSDLTHLNQLFHNCLKEGKGLSMAAYARDGELLSAAFYFIHHRTVYYLKGSSTEAGKKNSAMVALMDHVISLYSETHQLFDFGGSRIPSIATFFRKFGAEDHYYSFIQRNQPFLIHLSKRLYHKLSN